MSTDITSTDSTSNSLASGTQPAGLNPNPYVYQSLISPRSRRLRTAGIVLLVAVLLMAVYGILVLMPSLNHATHLAAQSGAVNKAMASLTGTGLSFRHLRPDGLTEQEHKVIVAKLLFGYGYWTLCGGLIVALIVVSWLDFRELARNYDAERHRIYVASLVNRGETSTTEEAVSE